MASSTSLAFSPGLWVLRFIAVEPLSLFRTKSLQVFQLKNNASVVLISGSIIVSRDDRFSGYTVFIDDRDDLRAFLPACRAGRYFREPSCDASGKFIAFKLDRIHPNGERAGNVFINAASPLSMEYDKGIMFFPMPHDCDMRVIGVMLNSVQTLARRCNISDDPNELTGDYWKLRIKTSFSEYLEAVPFEVLI